MKKDKKTKIGRPTEYSPEIADLICDLISNSNKSLATVCKDERIKLNPSTIYNWLNNNKAFLDKYACAKDCQADFLAEEIIEIADDNSSDIIITSNSEGDTIERENHEFISRSRVRIDARKWVASKLKPKKYGDKLDVGLTIDTDKEIVRKLFPTLEEFSENETN